MGWRAGRQRYANHVYKGISSTIFEWVNNEWIIVNYQSRFLIQLSKSMLTQYEICDEHTRRIVWSIFPLINHRRTANWWGIASFEVEQAQSAPRIYVTTCMEGSPTTIIPGEPLQPTTRAQVAMPIRWYGVWSGPHCSRDHLTHATSSTHGLVPDN
jgi:hypothetical protein